MAEYIDRDAVLNAVLELPPKMDEQGYGWLGRRGVWQMIADFKAADVCSHGEWVVCGDGENVPYLCSHCGKTVPAILIEKYPHNFCPNCGAKMT